MSDPHDGQFENVADMYGAVERWMQETRAPRHAGQLLELVRLVQPERGIGLDLGAYGGGWCAALATVSDLQMVAVDIARTPLADAVSNSALPVAADMLRLPFANECASFVWSRDTLSMLPDLNRAFAEIRRVLRPGAGALVYAAVGTERLEPIERAELVEALDLPGWFGNGRSVVDSAIATAGLSLVHIERFSPEHQEAALLDRDAGLWRDLAVLGRCEREREALEAATSVRWAARFRAWSAWPAYLLLGKLHTYAWVIRRPS